MKKAAPFALLFGLITLQLSICESLLPYEWPHPISLAIDHLSPRSKYDTHPDMAWEFELDFRQHPLHRAIADGFILALATLNGFFIVRVWSKFRGLKR